MTKRRFSALFLTLALLFCSLLAAAAEGGQLAGAQGLGGPGLYGYGRRLV